MTPEAGTPWQSDRGIEYFPTHPTLANYDALFANVPFGTYFRNSTIVATAATTSATQASVVRRRNIRS